MNATNSPVIETRALSMRYQIGHGRHRAMLHAVDDVSLAIAGGECLGLVGESGCGKSTLARMMARLAIPTEGRLVFEGVDVDDGPRRSVAGSARAGIQMVFQDPTESLNPHLTVAQAIADPIGRLIPAGRGEAPHARVARAMAEVGLAPALASRFPHQLSGGQRARVGIARAIAVSPRLLILDEPTAALDVSVQAVVLRLLGDLRARRGMAYLFVSHDLNVVRLLSDRIAVMYLGRIVELAQSEELFRRPLHPYTRALLAATPDPSRRGMQRARLEGVAASPIDPDPNCCRFADRCTFVEVRCRQEMPILREIGAHRVACHLSERITQLDIP